MVKQRCQRPVSLPGKRLAGLGRAGLAVLTALAAACSDSPSGPVTGSLAVTIVGLPAGAQNALVITGPTGSGFSRVVNVSDTLESLVPGTYTVAANTVTGTSGVYAAPAPTQQVEVEASLDPASVTVQYEIITGSIALTVTGLPEGSAAAITISGDGGYSRQITESTTLSSLPPGGYVVTSGSVSTASGHIYSPVPLVQLVNVFAAETPRNVTSRYNLATGALEVSVTGLPPLQGGSVTVNGPAGFTSTVTTSTTLLGLFPGTYSVVGGSVGSGPTWAPTPPSQNVDVTASLTPARATVSYVEVNLPPPPQFNLSIDGMYITQAVQSYAGTVPLLAGMPGLLRVFVKASAPNTIGTTVRARLYQGTVLSQTLTLLPNVPGVPTAVTEGTLGSSWNALIPASLVQPGLRVLVDVDPTNTVSEADEGDNAFPVSGTPFEPRVEFTAPLNLTLVPVYQTATGLTGNVSSSNLDEYLVFARKVLPIRDYQVTLHETFTTSAPAVESNNGNNGWLQILSEVNTLRVAEGTANYYMGIVGTTYNSGVAGFAFVPGRASVAWDKLPSAAPIAAHELAHSLGRLHAPCGGPAAPDPSYPYVLGTIGVYGYDIGTGILKSPGTSDLMGYCGYGWISDYNYVGILNYRLSTPSSAVAAPAASASRASETFVQAAVVRNTLVVWGRIENGRLVLEPAFSARTKPVLPARPGPYRIEARTASGQVLFSYAFEGERPADVEDQTARQFAFAIPMDDSAAQSISRISLISQSGLRSERAVASTLPGPPVAFEAIADGPGEVRFRLTDPSVPLAVIRDRASQRIIAFARPSGQPVKVRTRGVDFDVELSDGVRSRGRAVRALRR